MIPEDRRQLEYLAKKEVKVTWMKKKKFHFSKLHPLDVMQGEGAIDLTEKSPCLAINFSWRGNS